jgi:hypothetical protein
MSEERSKELLAHYAQNPIDFSWIPYPNQHSYRWRTNKGRWVTARRRIRNHQTLAKAIGKDVFVTKNEHIQFSLTISLSLTSMWLH